MENGDIQAPQVHLVSKVYRELQEKRVERSVKVFVRSQQYLMAPSDYSAAPLKAWKVPSSISSTGRSGSPRSFGQGWAPGLEGLPRGKRSSRGHGKNPH